jgi:hypothetical protein
MKSSSLFNIVISVVVVSLIIMSLLSSCCNVRPYSRQTFFTHEYPYEGFSGMSINYNNNDPKVSDSGITNFLINDPNSFDCKKVHGFDGLFCKPNVADVKIDKFSDAKGDSKCFGQSSGLSNSKGSLCLGNDLTKLLQTRGGNQTSGPDQYGSK